MKSRTKYRACQLSSISFVNKPINDFCASPSACSLALYVLLNQSVTLSLREKFDQADVH